MTLPFFSQGGTSLMVNLMAIFLLIEIAQKSSREKTQASG
jgi:cell division protein FtsW (lipid II flippase)